MPLLETCNELFGSSDLYIVLGVEKTASQGQIKKAYHKVSNDLNAHSSDCKKWFPALKVGSQGSLKVHPDRVAEDEREICTKKFQVGIFVVELRGTHDLGCMVQNYLVLCICCNYSALQCLSAVYTVLSDESRRGLYDESGEVCVSK